jgi:hypothetical protein
VVAAFFSLHAGHAKVGAMRMITALVLATSVGVAAWTPSAMAQSKNPSFNYTAEEEAKEIVAKKEVEWKASAQAGLILTTGNSRITTLSAGAKASRKAGGNKLALEAAGAFARSSIFLAVDDNGNGVVDPNELQRLTSTTNKMWMLLARYDRFLTARNALYVTALASADTPAGKEFVGGGQAGYSRTLVKTDVHELVVEAGYDYSYESFTATDKDADSIHSARGFAGYEGKLSEDTGLSLSGEILLNVNELDDPVDPLGKIDRFEDARFLGKLGISTKMIENIQFKFGFTAKYDNAPAPLSPFGIPYAAGFVPLADKLDTLTEVSLLINFL